MRKLGLLALLGMVPVWAGEMPEKAADYHAALVKRPESAALFDRFRDAWLEERSVEDLEKELLARAEAKEAGAWATLARAWLAAGKTEQALEAFDKARQQSPAGWLDLETAKLRMAAKDFAAAEKDALAVPEGDPMRLEAVKLAGLACLRAERIDDALAHWTKAVAAAPGDIGLLEDLTELTRREGRFDLALDYCGKWRDATADAYGKAMATLRRAELLLGSQRFEEAMTELAAVLAVSADDSWMERETLARSEQAHRQRGDSTGWAKWIGAQAAANPSRLNFRRTHSQALAAAGKTDEALEVLTEVMKRSPGDIAVRWQRIGLLEQAMKLAQAYDECAELAAREKSETAGLRLAELAFRLEKKDELKRALDGVLAATDPAKRVGLAGLYARYGLPEGSERIWREEAGGEQGSQALRQLAKHLKTAGRDKDALEVWQQLGAREVAQDRMEAAQMLAAAGERGAAREILMGGRERFSAEPGYEAALADLAMSEEKADEARVIYLKLARAAKRPDELTAAAKGWLRTSAAMTDPSANLGDETADRCLRAAWLAAAGKPLPAVRDGDELERSVRQALLREQGRWPDAVKMMEALPGERGPLFLSELAEAKTAAGDLPGALAATQAWRARVPDQAGPWLFEAGTLEKLGRLPDATLLLRRAAARFEDNEDIARRLFSILQQSSDPREALEWAWKRHDRSENESVRTSWLREILHVSKQREQLDDLQARFEERARRDPASPGPLVALAELAKARGDSRVELDFLRRAAVNAPRDLAVISALAALEERSGEMPRALERHAALARLAPGPDSARSLAQAKIRLGDIEGGMRDMQALAGEKGIDLRALEQSVGDLASRGYVEEAIRLIAAVAPAQRTARLDFMLGTLLDIDGREKEAVDAFGRVMTEPDDPAETQQRAEYGYEESRRMRQYLQILQFYGGREERIPGTFTGMQVPESLVQAKMTVKSQLSRLAMQQGGEIWTKAAAAIPELAVATPEQWREVMDFSQSRANGYDTKWWDFIGSHPANPLGLELVLESGQASQARPEQLEDMLKTNPPLRFQMQLRSGGAAWRADNLEFLESINPVSWQDETMRRQSMWMVQRLCMLASDEKTKPPVTIGDCKRGLVVLEKAGLTEPDSLILDLLRARLALLEENPDGFVKHLNAWSVAALKLTPRQSAQVGYGSPMDGFAQWRKKAGDAAAEAVIARIASPLLRCQLAADPKPEQRIARVKRELAALPKDVPAETRRGLIRLSWSYRMQGPAMDAAVRKELEATAADESDVRLAFEATVQLMQRSSDGLRQSREGQLKLQTLLSKLAASPDPADQTYAAQFGGYFGRSRNQPVPQVTRWGAANSFSSGGSSRNSLALPAIIAMEDKDQASREAARFLESTALALAGRSEYLTDMIKSLSKADLLDRALARISLPPDAGLGRRVAMLTLLDACSKADRARELLAEIAKSRPWETRWTVDLALRTADDAEMRHLLDSVAGRGDFDRILMELIAPRNREVDAALSRLKRLADWAPQAKGRRTWIGPAMQLLVNGGSGGLQGLTEKNEVQLECYRRFVKIALDDRLLAEAGFRVMFATSRVETPDAITDAARRALVSGAYTSEDRTLMPNTMRELAAHSALEHLVQVAAAKGDEAVFPADFRERLKAADPASEAWLAKLLAAKNVSELPDLTIDPTFIAGWVTLARREAAMLRAGSLPGRDAWLVGIFREKKYQSQSANLRLVIRASLLEAEKKKAMPARILTLLEAAAGPRKDWNKKPPAGQPYSEFGPASAQLPQAAAVILAAAAESDAATLLSVLDHFREAHVPVSQADFSITRLAQFWRAEMQPPRNATLAELLGKKRDAAYTIGFWTNRTETTGNLTFQWALPKLLQNLQLSGREGLVKTVKSNPDAGFPDLLQAWQASGDKSLQRRALLKASPDLAKLPAEIRRAVIESLTTGMGPSDMEGLPAQAAAQLREKLDADRKQRIETARASFKSMQVGSPGRRSQSAEIGSLVSQVIGDDDAFVEEILTAWRPVAEADKSGKEIEAFTAALISYTRQNARSVMAVLRLLDSLWKGSPPPLPRNSNRSDLMQTIWSRLESQALRDPELWRQAATLSPKLQLRFWSGIPDYSSSDDLKSDPKFENILREAAKGNELSRTALEWRLQRSAIQSDRQAKIDETPLLDFAKALKNAGAPAETIAALVCRAYPTLARMENPGTLMAETPVLLDGLKSLPEEQVGTLFQGVQNLWRTVQRERQKAEGMQPETARSVAVYPVESAVLLKFVFSRKTSMNRYSFDHQSTTAMVLATGDGELLELWIKFGGKSLAGDLTLILTLLEKDRIDQAVALAPEAGNNGYSESGYFTARTEALVAKLRADPSSQAFRLAVTLSLRPDARGEDAPAMKLADRKTSLTEEYERVRSGLPAGDRATLCLALGLDRNVAGKNLPALDEFASEAAAREFQKSVFSGENPTAIGMLFVPAVCSRVYAGDISGIPLLATSIANAPPGKRQQSTNLQSTIFPVHACLITYANRLDAKLPEASAEIILSYAKALADLKNPMYQGVAATYVHLAATNAATLEAGLKRCGLEGVKPTGPHNPYGGIRIAPETLQAMMRVALLHPATSQGLLESLGPPQVGSLNRPMLPLLREPALRARISPALFLQWHRNLWNVDPEDLEAINLYATERRADFDEAQRTELDGLLKPLGNRAEPMDPARLEQMRARQREQEQRNREQRERSEVEELMRMTRPR